MPNGCSEPVAKVIYLFNKIPFIGDIQIPWQECCDEHDLWYEQGGPMAWRKFADQKLRDCMVAKGYPIQARIYYLGVRLLGSKHWNVN